MKEQYFIGENNKKYFVVLEGNCFIYYEDSISNDNRLAFRIPVNERLLEQFNAGNIDSLKYQLVKGCHRTQMV